MNIAKMLVTLCFLVAAPSAQSNDTPPLLMKLVPYQQWAKLPGNVDGLLVLDQVQGINQIDHMGGVSIPNKSYSPTFTFNYELDNPVVIYFPSKGEGTPRFSGAAQLVRLEVNEGNGSEGQIHFIASGVELLHKDFLESPGELLSKFLAPYSDPKSIQSKAAALQLDATLVVAKCNDVNFQKMEFDHLIPEDRSGFVAHWTQNDHSLHFAFYTNRIYIHLEKDTALPLANCSPDQEATRYGSEYVTTLNISETGVVEKDEQVDAFILNSEKILGVCTPGKKKPERK